MPGPIPFLLQQDKRPTASSDNIIPTPPAWLNSDAKKIFKDAASKIVEYKMGGSADQTMIAIYAFQYERLQKISKCKEITPRMEKLQNDLVSSVLSLSNQLGLSPGGRARLRIKEESSLETDLQKAMNK